MGQEKIAILDLGTNTFHLLIASINERGFRILLKEKLSVKVGEGGINHRKITKAAKERALRALDHFKLLIDKNEVTGTFAFGTSAIRTATNGRVLIREIYERTGIEIKIISGNQEAQYIYTGVRQAVELGENMNLIMDIGGGSVEFIIGNSFTVLWKKSFEIGAQRLTDKFHKHDPVIDTDLSRLNKFLEKELKPLLLAVEKFKPKVLVGSSGTFDTLVEIYYHNQRINKGSSTTEFHLPVLTFYNIYKELINKNRIERLNIPGMVEMRVDMIVMSVALTNFIISRIGISSVKTSAYSLKEGILYSIIEKKQVKKLSA